MKIQLFRTRAPKNEGNKVPVMLHEAQRVLQEEIFSLLCNLPLGSLGL